MVTRHKHHNLLHQALLILAIFSSLTWGGACLKSSTAPIPGAANSFDSSSYLVLVTTDNVIQTTKTDLASNAFPASMVGNVKAALNDLIKAYDVANIAYQSYHTAALAGMATTAQQAAVTTGLNKVQSATATLTTVKGGS